MQDSWYSRITAETGNSVTGAAACQVRIKAAGGMDKLAQEIAYEAAQAALQRVNSTTQQPKKPHLRLVKKAA